MQYKFYSYKQVKVGMGYDPIRSIRGNKTVRSPGTKNSQNSEDRITGPTVHQETGRSQSSIGAFTTEPDVPHND